MARFVTLPLHGTDIPGPMNCVVKSSDSITSSTKGHVANGEFRCRRIRLKQRKRIDATTLGAEHQSALYCLSRHSMTNSDVSSIVLNVIEGSYLLTNECVLNDPSGGVHIEVQSWVQEWLQVECGSIVECELIPDELPMLSVEDKICAQFMGYWSFLSWSEVAARGEVFKGALWNPGWPEGALESTVSHILNLTLPGTQALAIGGLVAIDYLELQLVFQINQIKVEPSQAEIVLRGRGAIDITSTSPANEKSENDKGEIPAAVETKCCPLICQKEARETIGLILDATGSSLQHGRLWYGPHSVVVSGPRGSGKSTLLHDMSIYASSKGIYSIFARSSSSSSGPSQFSLFRINVTPSASPVIHDKNPMGASLLKLMISSASSVEYYCDSKSGADRLVQYSNSSIESLKGCLFCLIIDELNDFVTDDGGESESSAGACLRELLYKISTTRSAHASFDLVVIGSCAETSNSVIKRFMRPPGFELSKYVLSPLEEDRKSLILNCLTTCGYSVGKIPGDDQFDSIDTGFYTRDAAIRLARMTHGFLPCDIASLVRKAFVYSNSDHITTDVSRIPSEIAWSDFLLALSTVGPSQLSNLSSSGFAEVVTRQHLGSEASLTWNDFGGAIEAKNKIKLLVSRLAENGANSFLNDEVSRGSSKTLSDALQDKPKGIVLTGPTGHGKSYLAKIIAAEASFNFINVNSTGLLSKYYGETEENVRKLFATARSVAPAVLFFDEFEGLSAKRSAESGSADSGVAGRVLSTFLNELDGISTSSGGANISTGDILVIVACLNVGNLDAALVRPGRLQHHFDLGTFHFEDACDIVENLITRLPRGTNVLPSPAEIIRIFEDRSRSRLSPAKVVAYFQRGVLEAVKDIISQTGESYNQLESNDSMRPEIRAEHFAGASLN